MVSINNSTYGNISSIGATENFNITPDDRQTLVKTVDSLGVGGVVVEDFGYVENGEVIAFSAVFDDASYEKLLNIWKNRSLSDVIFEDGKQILSARLVLKSTTYFHTSLASYKKVSLEVWKV